jgi:hypothetical protein
MRREVVGSVAILCWRVTKLQSMGCKLNQGDPLKDILQPQAQHLFHPMELSSRSSELVRMKRFFH